jgi:hypothetical protein
MFRRKSLIVALNVLIALVAADVALAQAPRDSKAPEKSKSEFKLPPGWTEEDVQAMMAAATPGKMHEHLAKDVGVWHGKHTMWMAPGTDPIKSESTSKVTKMLDGRFTKLEVEGEIPGMGPFHAVSITGFDNVAQKFTSTWIDNHGTGMMNGTGELSPDGKTLTWKFTYNCPIAKKPVVMRQIETVTGSKTKTLEMFGADPKSGKEFKMMTIELTKK